MSDEQARQLERSRDMPPVHGTVDIDVPADVLWNCFRNAQWWARWNGCMFWGHNTDLVQGDKLIWAFEPLRWWYFYKLPGVGTLVEVEPNRKVTWEITALPGFYARHTYSIEDLGNGRSRFGSWEQAMGPTFRLLKFFWVAHFVFVKNRSLQGARLLESIYKRTGRLDHTTLPTRRGPLLLRHLREVFGSSDILGLQYRPLAPGVWAALGGGGNSLVIKSDDEVLVVDPKMWPYDRQLKNWIARHVGGRVTAVIDTHYHFDHTRGNRLYPEAAIIAHRSVPAAMQARDADYWERHPAAVPGADNLVDEALTIRVGDQEVHIHHARRAHTTGDLWVHARVADRDFIATGDFATIDHYPFFDTSEHGADPQGWIAMLRELAAKYPDTTFIPGHGPVASAADLLHHAHYIEFLDKSVAGSRADGLDEGGTARNVDLWAWKLSLAPIFHYGLWFLSNNTNVRSIFRLQTGRHS